uniref:Uncharacterized protein n=1 Tax=viral metagenome TaxID=1070528 RepID=A0A6C0J900_9ZZZZ
MIDTGHWLIGIGILIVLFIAISLLCCCSQTCSCIYSILKCIIECIKCLCCCNGSKQNLNSDKKLIENI